MIGRVLGQRYQILEKIGDGGMATVYRGEDTLLERRVAVKVLKPQLVADEEFLRRFRREARSAASLSHPNIVNIFDVGQEDDVHFIVMEYIKGPTLKDLIRERGALGPADSLYYAVQIARALEHAHANGLIHRDIKPHNVLLAADGRLKVTDFGIARLAGGSTMTYGTEAIVGSVTYFSPEQARGEAAIAASDLYSLGVVLYEMLAGRPPFTGEGPFGLALKHLQEQPQPLREVLPGVPRALEAVVDRALQKHPDDRYQSATEMRQALETIVRKLQPGQRQGRSEEYPTLVPPTLQRDQEAAQGGEKRRVATRRVKRGKRIKIAIWLAVLAVLALASVYGYRALVNWWVVPEVIVPNVVGISLTEAQERLEEFGLAWRVVGEQYHEEAPPNEVLRQRPEPGDQVREGRVIDLWLSKGRELVSEMPEVIGLPVREARELLVRAGLTIGGESAVYNDEYEANLVIGQNPAPGTRGLIRGTPVYLEVSLGPEPVTLTLPSFLGEPVDYVRQRLRELDLVEGAIIEEEGPGTPGTVVGQTPAPGTVIETGTVIDLVVVKGLDRSVKQAVVTIDVPEDGPERQDVKVVVVDKDGQRTRDAYQEEGVAAGTRLRILVDYEGDSALIRIIIDGQEVREYPVY